MAKTKTMDGVAYPAAAFLYVPDPDKPSTWKLRIGDKDGNPDIDMMGAAAAALVKGFRGRKVQLPDNVRKGLIAKLRGLYKKLDKEPPASIAEAGADDGLEPLPDDDPLADELAAIAEAAAVRAVEAAEADHGDLSLDQLSEKIRDAWTAYARAHSSPFSPEMEWAREVYGDSVIVKMGDDHYRVPYSENEDGEIVFDTEAAQKVERQWVAVEAFAGEEWLVGPVAEADGGEPQGWEWDVLVIKAGRSKNRRVYKPKVLQEAAPLFEGARVLARSDADHVAGREKSVEKVVGWLSEARYEKGAIRARLTITENADWLRKLLLSAWRKGKKDIVGLSIVAEGRAAEVFEKGERLFEVEEIAKVSSVDVVFDPAAGGGLVKLVAAEGEEKEVGQMPDEVKLEDLTLEHIKEANPELHDRLMEAAKAEAGEPSGEQTPPAPTGTEGPAPATQRVTETEEPEEEQVPAYLSRTVVQARLSETELPEVSRKRVAKRFAGKAFAEAALEEAVQDEIGLWEDLEKDGLVKSSGQTREEQVQVGLEEAEKAKAALDGFFEGEDVKVGDQTVPRYRSFRQAYSELTGDGLGGRAIRGKLYEADGRGRLGFSLANGGRVSIRRLVLQEADNGPMAFAEALLSSTWVEILGDSITRRMLREYSQSNLRTWESLVDVVPANDFRTQRRMRFGGYGNLPTVAQNAAYAALTTPGDEEATYSVTKRGGTETITIEAIANDDVGSIRRIPGRLARGAAQTLHEFVFNFLADNANIYDATALFTSGHANLGSAALSSTAIKNALARMRKQTDMSSSKRLGLIGKHLWVPVDLEDTAFELTASENKPGTADNDANFVQFKSLDYTVVDYWTDANNWFLSADKSDTPLIEVGFYGSEEPELFTQDLPNVGDLFTNDRIVYKIRFIFGGAVSDFRGLDGSVVA